MLRSQLSNRLLDLLDLLGLGAVADGRRLLHAHTNCRSELARDPLIFLVSTNIQKSLVLILFKYFWL
jgi:hypothetical protein